MKVLLIDSDGTMLDLALKAAEYKHKVKHFIGPRKNNEESTVGKGLTDRVDDWKPHMDWADLIILGDNNRYLYGLEAYRDKDYPIWGPNLAGAKLEMDREHGQEVMQEFSGIEPVEYAKYETYEEAIEFITKTKKRMVSKPCADLAKELSYAAASHKDMLWTLNKWKDQNGTPPCPFILQEFSPGVEMAVGGYFSPKAGWSKWLTLSFEHKKLMPDNWGPNTGEMGTVMKMVQSEKLAEQMLFPLTSYLKSINYSGYIDVAVIIQTERNKGKPNFLEWTARMGWPLTHLQVAVTRGDPVQWMKDMLDGYDTLEVSTQVCTAFVLAHSDFPFNKRGSDEVEGVPVYCDWTDPHIHPADIKMGKVVNDQAAWEDGRVSAGTYAAVITGLGKDVKSSAEAAYKRLKSIELPSNPIARSDIGARLEKELDVLHKYGYALGIDYGV